MGIRDLYRLIEEMAARQHGLVSRGQLLARGVPPRTVANRVRGRRMRPVHRGVYRVGPVASPHWEEMAAILACGLEALISHRSAAVLWRIAERLARGALVDVTIPWRQRRQRPGIRFHRVKAPLGPEATMVHGIPVTTPLRTLLDLSAVAGTRELERAVARAEHEGLANRFELAERIAAMRGHAGVPALRALLAAEIGPALTLSEAEERLLALIRKAALPEPRTNVEVRGHLVDFHWPAEGVVAEVDGFAFHHARDRFENDRRRDADLQAAGIRVLRVTWLQITNEPEVVLVRLAQMLARGRG